MSDICTRCIRDVALLEFVRDHGFPGSCEACGRRCRVVASLEDVAERAADSIREHYADPAEWLMYESAEGGYQGETFYTNELVDSVLDDETDELKSAVFSELGAGALWCKNDPHGPSEHEVLQWSWESFSKTIAHERRFFFMAKRKQNPVVPSDELDAEELLAELSQMIGELGLVRAVAPGAIFYRARAGGLREGKTPADMAGPPAASSMQANRMSPPGISIFYGATSARLAVAEAVRDPGIGRVGRFVTTRPVRFVDLSVVPRVPSIFSNSTERGRLIFLNRIVAEFSRPIDRTERVHLDYLPTQVVSEYIRTEFVWQGAGVDGIIFPSSLRLRGSNVAAFGGPEIVAGAVSEVPWKRMDPWLELRDVRSARTNTSHDYGTRYVATPGFTPAGRRGR